jgi:hypothetical protein
VSDLAKTPTPEEAQPNRRRAVVACSVFAVVLAGTIYLLRTNLAYLKWRFIGSEPELISDALETGAISPDQVVALVNSGATYEVRLKALRTMGSSPSHPAPFGDHMVEAIRGFAADLPEHPTTKRHAVSSLVRVVSNSQRRELIDVLEAIAADPDFLVRSSVCHAFDGVTDFG